MANESVDDLELAPSTVAKQAAHNFAAALAETTQFKAFEQALEQFRQDETAQRAMEAFQEKQTSWRALMMLNALSPEQQAELDGLQNAFFNQPVAQEYFSAQSEFTALCRSLGDTLSESIGLNYAAACGVSCCG